MSNYEIRDYKETDIEEMIALGQSFLDEEREEGTFNYYKGIDINHGKVYKYLIDGLARRGFFGKIVVSQSGDIVGVLCAEVSECVFSDDMLAHDRLFYVKPGFIDLKGIRELVLLYITWAKSYNLREIQIANSSGFRQRAFELLMKNCGLTNFSSGYSMRF